MTIGIILGVAYKLLCAAFLLNGQSSIFYYLLSENLIFSYIFSICLGLHWGFIYKAEHQFSYQDWLYSSIAFTIALIPYIIASSKPQAFYKLGFDIFFTPLSFLICYYLCRKFIVKTGYLSHIIAIIGLFSYHIYLIHQPILFLTLPVLMKRLPFSKLGNLVVSLILILVIISVITVFFIKLDNAIRNKISNIIK